MTVASPVGQSEQSLPQPSPRGRGGRGGGDQGASSSVLGRHGGQ